MSRTRPNDEDQHQDDDRAQQQAEERALQEYNAEILEAYAGLREAFMEMLAKVPEPDGDASAMASIIGTILQAETADDLDKPWDTDGMRKHFGQTLIVHSITKRPSDYEGGLGVYLGCMCDLTGDGVLEFVSCGSVASVVQLVRAHTLGMLPLIVVPTLAKKATPKGYWPYHLQVQGRVTRS